MAKMKVFNMDELGPARESLPLPERLIEGSPEFKSWQIDSDKDGKVSSGVWEATPGVTRSIKGTTWEYCTILSGVVEITEDGKAPVRLQAGDTFVLKPGFVGVWKTIETVRKLWVVVN